MRHCVADGKSGHVTDGSQLCVENDRVVFFQLVNFIVVVVAVDSLAIRW